MAENGNGNGKLRVDQGLAIQLIVWLVAALLTYGAINSRVAVVESQMHQFRSDINEIKSDVKSLLRRP